MINVPTHQVQELANPFPGLRPFNEDESHLYFGREDQTKEVLDKLLQNRFISIIGTSGIGKSSFINCGVFPVLHKGQITQWSDKWSITSFRPGESPLKNLINAVLDTQDLQTVFSTDTFIQHPTELFSYLKQRFAEQPQNYLWYIDQFEEIFRFKELSRHSTEESALFIQFILDAIGQSEVPIFVVLTMRSDFLGNCSQYPLLTQKINHSQFLIPYMTRAEKERAIVGPIEKMGGKIDARLVKRILDDVGDNPDQLPIMQHALMRTWNIWQAKYQMRDDEMNLAHYEEIGTMQHALSVHANEAFNDLNDQQKKICSKIFKTITEITPDGKRIRRPTKLVEIAHIANASLEEVIQVINLFRREDRGFLMPPQAIAIDRESIIDLSHETLIRIWGTLNSWVEEEASSVKTYLELAKEAEDFYNKKFGHLNQPKLGSFLAWQQKHEPSKAWGVRYHPAYDATMLFLRSSEQTDKKKIQDAIDLQKRRLRNARLIAVVLTIGIIIAGIFGFYAFLESERAESKAIEAEKQKINAKNQERIAIQKAKDAEESAKQARIAKIAADSSASRAERAKKEAVRNEEIAKLATRQAKLEEAKAKIQERKARDAKERADIEAELAKISKEIAEIEREKAYRLRIQSIANAMAIRSKQMSDSVEQKALVASQAFKFHERSGGDENDPYIYDGLYYALKGLKGDNYNKLIGHTANVRDLAQSNGNEVYSTGSDGRIIRWNTQTQQILDMRIDSTKLGNRIHRAIALNNNGKLASAGNYPFIQLLDAQNLKAKPIKIPVKADQVWFMDFANGNLLITADETGNISLWDINSATQAPKESKNVGGKIEAVAVRGNTVAYSKGNQVVFFNTSNIASETPLFTDNQPIQALAFSQNGRYLAMGNAEGTVQVWDMATRQTVGLPLKGHKARINALTFSKDGTQLASASFDKTVRIWNVMIGQNLQETEKNFDNLPIILADHKDWVWSIRFSPDGKRLLAGCKDKLVRSWHTNVQDMANQICPNLRRNMSQREWERFVAPTSEVPYEKTCSNYAEGKEK